MSRVTELLEERGVEYEPMHHRSAWTALGEAVSLGVPAEVVAKAVVLDVAGRHAIAVIPASRRLSLRLAGRAVGDKGVSIATEAEIRAAFPGFELGALPPLSALLGAPVYVDETLTTREWVVFAAGSREESVCMRTADLIALDSAAIAPLTHRPG